MITRFAPSPTGPLHLGHAFSALVAHDLAAAAGGTFLLRIEDIDQSRARPEWETQIYDDLHWLGLTWPKPVMRQSDRLANYAQALDLLWARGLLYPCTCTRRDIQTAISAPQEGVPTHGPDGVIYPGTCRQSVGSIGPRPHDSALRIDIRKAVECIELDSLFYSESSRGSQQRRIEVPLAALSQSIGDVVVSRADMQTSYHLSVVLDDAAQGVTDVVRGQDLSDATQIHLLLQHLLGLATPIYHHHRLIRDDAGKRLAKRDDARALSKYRAEGAGPDDIRRLVGL